MPESVPLSSKVAPRTNFRVGRYVAVALISTVGVALVAYAVVRGLQPGRPVLALIAVAQRKPGAVSMATLGGGEWSTGEHAGQVIVLNYFATWCEPCREELPDFSKMAGEYGPRGVTMAAISIDMDGAGQAPRGETLAAFQAAEKLPFPILLPPPDSPLFQQDMEIPQTVLLDRRGNVALHITGKTSAAELGPFLEQLLKE